jgi:hypothetical protein
MKANRQFQSVTVVSMQDFKREKQCPSTERKHQVYLNTKTLYNAQSKSSGNLSGRPPQRLRNIVDQEVMPPVQSSMDVLHVNSFPRQFRQSSIVASKPQMKPLFEPKRREKERIS